MGCLHSNKRTIEQIPQPSEEQIEELLQRKFTRSEIVDWHRVFVEKCATDRSISSFDAGINKSLFIDYFQQLHPTGDVSRLTELFFHAFDRNNDDIVDFMELMCAIAVIRRGDLKEKCALIFSLLDSDRTDCVDRVKLVQMMEALYQMKGVDYRDGYNILMNRVDRMITRFDQENNEGRICRSKFIDNCDNDPILRGLLEGI